MLSCVMVLMGKQTDWATSKRVLGEANFLASLKSFDWWIVGMIRMVVHQIEDFGCNLNGSQ